MEERNESGYSEGRKHTLKANELRIGNLVMHDGNTYTVTGIDIGRVWISRIIETGSETKLADINELHPILLDIVPNLIKKVDGTSFGSQLNFTIWVELEGVMLEQYGEGRELISHIKHIHQLQNIYFALTGEELTI